MIRVHPRHPRPILLRRDYNRAMRRAIRWTWNGLAVISLLLCLATAALWVRSYWVWNDAYFYRPPAYTARWALPYVSDVRSSTGGLGVGVLRSPAPLPANEVDRIRRDFPSYSFERIEAVPTYPQPDLSAGHLG